ncbi:1857_t:CDS:2 [Diversispora eburnea]|uniref:1857_t:CDS:1 n=1 Tax=Diversispora eburnea TaxID=1213867 RepID=A0A9N9C411_9GLOM|nr:1857_t:CDS:2 [Diversispora eburnea]
MYFRYINEEHPGITIEQITGKATELEVESCENISSVKRKFQDKEGIEPENQRLIFKDKPLDDKKMLSEYNIKNGDTLHLVVRLRGGSN